MFTARGTATGLDRREVTRSQLERWGVAYDELHLGKPSADVYVDDRAVHADAWMRGDALAPPGLPRGFGGELPVVAPPPSTTVVEVGRTFGGEPLRLDEHVERLTVLATAAGVAVVPGAGEVRSDVLAALGEATAAIGAGDDLVYAISLTDAPGAVHLDTGQGPAPPRLQVGCFSLRQPGRALAGLAAGEGRGAITVAAATARQSEAQPGWPLEADGRGGVRDGLGGRLAVVRDGRISLAAEAAAPSVAAAWFEELARGLEVDERRLEPSELDAADEIAIVGMPWCLLPVVAVDGVAVGGGQAGPLTRRLLERWSRAVGLDLSAQAAELAARRMPGELG